MEKPVQLKIISKRRLVDKSWLGRDEINHPNHQRKSEPRTHSSAQKGKKAEDEKQSNANDLLSRKTTKIYMLTTTLASPTHRDASTLKEHILGSFTGFTLSKTSEKTHEYITG